MPLPVSRISGYMAVAFAAAFLFFASVQTDGMLKPGPAKRLLTAPISGIEHFTLGYRDTAADMLWIRVLQDFDLCENPRAAKPALSPSETSKCHLGWVYQMLDRATDLAPRFELAYSSGSTVLSIAVDDREGARRLYDKALKAFPGNWSMHYRAAYHYLFEVGDTERAAELYVKAGKLGAPQWVYALAARLYTSEGKALIGKTILEDYLKEHSEGEGAIRARARLAEIQKTLAQGSSNRRPAQGR